MKFSLDSEPPSIAEISNEETELKKKIRPIIYLPTFLIIAAIVIFISSVLVLFRGPFDELRNNVFAFLAFIISSLVGFASLLVQKRCDDVNKSLQKLSDIPIISCEEALMICSTNSECEQYRQKVVRQGRKVTFGELAMMREAVPIGSATHDEAKKRRLEWACNKLHS